MGVRPDAVTKMIDPDLSVVRIRDQSGQFTTESQDDAVSSAPSASYPDMVQANFSISSSKVG
jgi:hypothetical protein